MLTPDDVKELVKPFQPYEHEFLKSAAYITESSITKRLETVDPGWTFEIVRTDHRLPIREGGSIVIVVTARLMVSGVWRDGVGMATTEYLRNKVDEKTGEVIEYKDHIEVNEAEKSAATDALKRCARLFGIGRYLLDLPGNVKGMDDLTKWLIANYSKSDAPPVVQNATSQPVATPPAPAATPAATLTPESAKSPESRDNGQNQATHITAEEWPNIRNLMLTALSKQASGFNYKERAATVDKMYAEGVYENTPNIEQGIHLTIMRLQAHHMKPQLETEVVF